MDISVTYDLTILSMSYGTPIASSQRGHMGTGEVKRGDQFHMLAVGIAKGF